MTPELTWLPEKSDWDKSLDGLKEIADPPELWPALVRMANFQLDFVQTGKLDRHLQRRLGTGQCVPSSAKPIKLALLGSSTLKHLIPGIRVGALRRDLWAEVYEGSYGMYQQELMDPSSELHQFKPTVLCLALDAYHLTASGKAELPATIGRLRNCWRIAKESFGCTVIQQTALPIFPRLLGNNEHRFSDSLYTIAQNLNAELRHAADEDGVHLLSVDQYAADCGGLPEWHDSGLWHAAKQEIHPRVSHLYGDLLGRLLAAICGRSYKCLVLDLDNTLWGGVIGDDGLQGIVLGQGSASGEAYVAFQRYALNLARRGVILAVCSKNDEANALAPFESHPDMVLRRADIACFIANWDDKASNLRRIAHALNVGIDSLVLADDSPFERNLVRQELPMVGVPELPADPSGFISCLDSAGYFEALSVTEEDLQRGGQYRKNVEREILRESSSDMAGYLRNLEMELIWKSFDEVGLNRIVQLINKTNQFNLTTKRYSEADVRKFMNDFEVLTLQLRLVDRFGDNGIIALLIGRLTPEHNLSMDTWLMSCRVLGRQVEETCLNILAERARFMGARNILGEYRPTAKNGMVKELFGRLGFTLVETDAEGNSTWLLDLNIHRPKETSIGTREDSDAGIGNLHQAHSSLS
jgi:FkbH-like protein